MTATAYEALLCETRPEVIETDEQYEAVAARLAELVRTGRRRTSDEARLMRLLAVLVEDYDRRHALPPAESTPAERLRYLLEISGRAPADLLRVFGQRSHVHEALQGKRPISAEHARKLGRMFRVQPGVFI
ncbi:MAG: transcriptional regulator [Acidobacteria bacterium]|nr:transcriptional regulator [Acidobacteriota bacterium]